MRKLGCLFVSVTPRSETLGHELGGKWIFSRVMVGGATRRKKIGTPGNSYNGRRRPAGARGLNANAAYFSFILRAARFSKLCGEVVLSCGEQVACVQLHRLGASKKR